MRNSLSHIDLNLLERGWEDLSDQDLLTLALCPGNPESRAVHLAGRVLKRMGSLRALFRCSPKQLREAGLNRRQSLALNAMAHLSRRARERRLEPTRSFHSSAEIYSYFRPLSFDMQKECFWVLLMNGKNRIKRIIKISEGSLTRSIVHPREVFKPAILESAAAVLFVHNHPSGDPKPSQEDIQITQRLTETGKVVGIRVLDHVIIGRYRYFSFADQGML